MKLSTVIITHWAYIEKEDKKLPLTQEQADTLRCILKESSTTKYIMIPDPKDPLGEPLWEGRAWNVVVKQIEWKVDPDAHYICDFGIKHLVHETCECSEKYKISPIVFRTAVWSIYPEVKYTSQVTPEIRNKVLASF